jgi:hypothetical protein
MLLVCCTAAGSTHPRLAAAGDDVCGVAFVVVGYKEGEIKRVVPHLPCQVA